jgi:hypothetical protein
VAKYPEVPVVYRRPILRACFGFFLLGTAAFLVWLVLDPPKDDPFTSNDWWLPLAFLVMFGPLYVYGSCRLIIDATHARIRNPFVKIDIPLGHITQVTADWNLRFDTAYGRYRSYGVEASSTQMFIEDYGTQDDLVVLVNQASATAGNQADPRARYRWSWPDPLFWAGAAGMIFASIKLWSL